MFIHSYFVILPTAWSNKDLVNIELLNSKKNPNFLSVRECECSCGKKDHLGFVNSSTFGLDNLPENIRGMEVLALLKLLSKLTVRIVIKTHSKLQSHHVYGTGWAVNCEDIDKDEPQWSDKTFSTETCHFATGMKKYINSWRHTEKDMFKIHIQTCRLAFYTIC